MIGCDLTTFPWPHVTWVLDMGQRESRSSHPLRRALLGPRRYLSIPKPVAPWVPYGTWAVSPFLRVIMAAKTKASTVSEMNRDDPSANATWQPPGWKA